MMFEEVFGIKATPDEEYIVTFEKNFIRKERINIEAFKEMVPFNFSEYSSKWKDGKWQEYAQELPAILIETKYGDLDLTDFIFSLEPDLSQDGLLWYEVDENYSICFTGISYRYNKDRRLFNRYSLSGYIFYK